MEKCLLPGERLCDLERRGFKLIQMPKDGCFSQDTVLLADFTGVKPGDMVCDLGAGDGALGMLLMSREPSITCAMVEIRADLCGRAERSAAFNGVAASVHICCVDLKEAPDSLGKGGFDLVVSNPPYHQVTRDAMAEGARLARQQAACDFPALARSAAALLRHRGRFCLVIPAARVLEAAEALRAQRLEPKRLRFAASFHGREPYLCLMEARKGVKAGLQVMPQLVQFDSPGQRTREMAQIYQKSGEMA